MQETNKIHDSRIDNVSRKNQQNYEELFTSGTTQKYGVKDNAKDILDAVTDEAPPAIGKADKKILNHDKKKTAFSIGFAVLFVVGFILCVVGIKTETPILSYVFFGVIIASSIIFIFVTTGTERRFMKKPTSDCVKSTALVVACTTSSTTRKNVNGREKIKIVYRIILSIDGTLYDSYSLYNFTPDSTVTVYTKGNPKKYCYIVTPEDRFDF